MHLCEEPLYDESNKRIPKQDLKPQRLGLKDWASKTGGGVRHRGLLSSTYIYFGYESYMD